jgi:MFS transporter, FSR family, fosmidomycin resistance protein
MARASAAFRGGRARVLCCAAMPQTTQAGETRRLHVLSRFGHGVNDTYWFILPVVLPMILSDYGLRYGGAGMILSAYLLLIAVLSVVVGRLSDRLPRWGLIGVGFVVAAAGYLAAGVSNALGPFVAALLFAGVGVSTFHPVMYGSLEEWIPRERGRVYGIFEFWGVAAAFVMTLVAGLLIKTLGWRLALVGVAIPGLAAGVLFLRSRPYRPQTGGAAPRERAAVPLGFFVLYLVANMVRFLAVNGAMSFVPTTLTRVHGLSTAAAGSATALFFLGGMLAAPIAGRIADRRNPLLLLLGYMAATVPVLLLMGFARGAGSALPLVFALGVVSLACSPTQNLLAARLGPRFGKGEVFGILMGVMTVANALGPALFGAAADRAGLAASYRLAALLPLASVALLAVLAALPSARRATAAPAA